MTGPTKTRIGFHVLHAELRLVMSKAHQPTSEDPEHRQWTRPLREAVTKILVDALRLLFDQKPSPRIPTLIAELEQILQSSLGHRQVLFKYHLGSTEPRDEKYRASEKAAYHQATTALMSFLWALHHEFPKAEVAPVPDSPDAEREQVARRLGRTRAGLDTFVSEWKTKYGQDLPWVVRKPGLPWFANIPDFEAWRATTEGQKSTTKKKVGRPSKLA